MNIKNALSYIADLPEDLKDAIDKHVEKRQKQLQAKACREIAAIFTARAEALEKEIAQS